MSENFQQYLNVNNLTSIHEFQKRNFQPVLPLSILLKIFNKNQINNANTERDFSMFKNNYVLCFTLTYK